MCKSTRLGVRAGEKLNIVDTEEGLSTRDGGVRGHQVQVTCPRGTAYAGAGDGIRAGVEKCTSARGVADTRARHGLHVLDELCALA